jgi:DNA-binding NarL/FixJ family response regulator
MAHKSPATSRASASTRILLVDDHRLFRAGLRALIEQMPHCTIVGEAATGEQAFAVMAASPADVVVMDIHLPDVNGIVASRRLLEAYPTVKILAVSSDPSAALVHEAMLAGLAGYLLKENSADELERALHAVLAGKVYLCPEVSTAIMDTYRQRFGANCVVEGSSPALSERDIELLRLIADGLRNKEIAHQLGLTVKSAETYRQRLMKKLHLDSTAGLTRYAIREGIVKA